jgi:hypothetical protein
VWIAVGCDVSGNSTFPPAPRYEHAADELPGNKSENQLLRRIHSMAGNPEIPAASAPLERGKSRRVFAEHLLNNRPQMRMFWCN